MTKEEAIELLEKEKAYMLSHGGDRQAEALDSAIKVMKQEPILDEIRAEIVDLGKRTMNDSRANGIWACRDIIDKYKAGSEVEE